MKSFFLLKFLIVLLGLAMMVGGCATERMVKGNKKPGSNPGSVNSNKTETIEDFSKQRKGQKEGYKIPFSAPPEPLASLVDQNSTKPVSDPVITEQQKGPTEQEAAEFDSNESTYLTIKNWSEDSSSDHDNENNKSIPLLNAENYLKKSRTSIGKIENNESKALVTTNEATKNTKQLDDSGATKEITPSQSFNQEKQNISSVGMDLGEFFSGNENEQEIGKISIKSQGEPEPSANTRKDENFDSSKSKIEVEEKPKLILGQNKDETNPSDANDKSRFTVELRDLIERVESPQVQDKRIFLLPPSSGSIEDNSTQNFQLGLKVLRNENNKEINTSGKVALDGQFVQDQGQSIDGRKNLVIEYSSSSKSSPKRISAENLELGFSDRSSLDSNLNTDNVVQQISFGDSIQESIGKTKPNKTKNPFSAAGKRKEYGNILDFISGKDQSSKLSEPNEKVRNYNRLRAWGPDDQDTNKSQPQLGSNPKKFNRALKWIRQKGRTETD